MKLLSCEFFTPDGIPADMLDQAEQVFGMRPTSADYKTVMQPYAQLRKVYEIERQLHEETVDELTFYCTSTIERFRIASSGITDQLAEQCYDRLYAIKEMSNKLRKYQRYVCLVHAYGPDEFGKRYTELF